MNKVQEELFDLLCRISRRPHGAESGYVFDIIAITDAIIRCDSLKDGTAQDPPLVHFVETTTEPVPKSAREVAEDIVRKAFEQSGPAVSNEEPLQVTPVEADSVLPPKIRQKAVFSPEVKARIEKLAKDPAIKPGFIAKCINEEFGDGTITNVQVYSYIQNHRLRKGAKHGSSKS